MAMVGIFLRFLMNFETVHDTFCQEDEIEDITLRYEIWWHDAAKIRVFGIACWYMDHWVYTYDSIIRWCSYCYVIDE